MSQDTDVLIKIAVLGPMRVTTAAGAPVELRGRRSRAILGMLALTAPRPVPRIRLTELLWDSRPREQADVSLRQCVSALHRALRPIGPDLFQTRGGHLTLRSDRLWVDALAIEDVAGTFSGALPLLRQRLLADLDGLGQGFDEWLEVERRRFAAKIRTFAESVLKGQIAPAEKTILAQELLRLDRASDVGWRALIVLHADRGEYVTAMNTYEQCCIALAEAVHGLPSFETQALIKDISVRSGLPIPTPRLLGAGATASSRSYATRMGVVPLRGLDQASEDLATGLVEEITIALGRFRGLSCIVLSHAVSAPHDPNSWRALGLNFVLDGSVQFSPGRVRAAVRLVDVQGGGEVAWSQKYDLQSSDMLTLQDEIASRIVAQLDPALMSREGLHAAAQGSTDATAYQLMLRAIPAIQRLSHAEFLAAGDLLATAAALDPDYAPVHAWWAYWHLLLLGQGWTKDSERIVVQLQDLTHRAVTLDPGDARALTLSGHVKGFTLQRLDEAFELHERALSINPHLPMAWLFSGLARTYAGHHDEAVRCIERAKELAPLDPHEFFFDMGLTFAQLLRGDYAAAIKLGRRALRLNPRFSSSCKCFLSALGHAGSAEETAEVLAHLLRLEPGFTVRDAMKRSPLVVPRDRRLYAEGLLRAGLSE